MILNHEDIYGNDMTCFALLDLSCTKCLTPIEVKQLTNTSFNTCIDKKETTDLFCTHLQTLFCQIDNGGRITNSDLCAPFLLNIGPKFTNLQHKCNVGYLPVEWMTSDIWHQLSSPISKDWAQQDLDCTITQWYTKKNPLLTTNP